ncbi:MAG: hypothetical protein ACRDVG_07140, partial [Jatrophihabitantaceae bacterium]
MIPPSCNTPTPLRWDEHTSVATRSYVSGAPYRCSIVFDYGPTQAIDALDAPSGLESQPVQISGARASVVRYNDINNH